MSSRSAVPDPGDVAEHPERDRDTTPTAPLPTSSARAPDATPGRTADAPSGGPGDPPAGRSPARVAVPRGVWAAVALAVLVVATAVGIRIVVGGLASLNPFKDGVVTQRTVDRSGPAVLKAVTDLGTLHSAGGYYEVVIDVERSIDHVPSFLAGRRVLFVAAGTVDATVELKDLQAGAVTVDETRTAATIRLPAPQLGRPQLDLERSYVYSEDRGLVDRIGDAVGDGSDDRKELYALAGKRLTEAAAANDELRVRAEASARAVLQGLLRPLGFTDVTVTFDAPPPAA
jgi:hypothetical protein